MANQKNWSLDRLSVRLERIETNMPEHKRKKFRYTMEPVQPNDSDKCEQIVEGTSEGQNALEEDACDWRQKVNSVQERNLFILKNSTLSDIILEVGPESTPFNAHKLILALGSPVFEAMFYGALAEKKNIISIPDIMPDGFKILLRNLYGDIIVLSNEVEALNAWIAADKYCVPKLKTECDNFFSKCAVSSSNVWELFENSLFLNLSSLISRCKEYLVKNIGPALVNDEFLKTKTETVKEILIMSSENAFELVLNSVIYWGKHKVNSEEAVSLAEALEPLLPHIRFGALTPSEFCKFLDQTNDLLDKSDALAIMKHLVQPFSYALPEWCSTIGCRTVQYCTVRKSSSVRRIVYSHDKECKIVIKKNRMPHSSE